MLTELQLEMKQFFPLFCHIVMALWLDNHGVLFQAYQRTSSTPVSGERCVNSVSTQPMPVFNDPSSYMAWGIHVTALAFLNAQCGAHLFLMM